jgi:hypothetical protein
MGPKKNTTSAPVEPKGARERHNRVLLSLTDEELERLTALARAEGLPLGTFARVTLFRALKGSEEKA